MAAAAQPRGQLKELTSARFFAAMSVLIGHFNDFLGIPQGLVAWVAGGGVSFFFVLSGFILCYVYWDTFAQGVARRDYRRYLVARFARIYPCYAMALLLITLLYAALTALRPGSVQLPSNLVSSWLANLFALQTFAPSLATQQFWNGPSWSISTELCFYLVCPFILYAIARRFSRLRALLLILAGAVLFALAAQALALYLVIYQGWSRELWLDLLASRNILWRLPEFVTGVVAARLLYGGHVAWLGRASARNAVLVAGLALAAVVNAAPWPTYDPPWLVMRQLRLQAGYMIPFAAVVLALAAGPTWASPLLKRPPMVFLGEVSYGIYIYHWIFWTLLAFAHNQRIDLPPTLVTSVVFLTIIMAAASYVWFERPARSYLRERFA